MCIVVSRDAVGNNVIEVTIQTETVSLSYDAHPIRTGGCHLDVNNVVGRPPTYFKFSNSYSHESDLDPVGS